MQEETEEDKEVDEKDTHPLFNLNQRFLEMKPPPPLSWQLFLEKLQMSFARIERDSAKDTYCRTIYL